MYKIAVYAICKNENQFVDKWINSMSEADYICVLDTGSTDGTFEKLQYYHQIYPTKVIIQQEVITPWRFDTARNESMKLIPKDADICMCTDLDELLVKGWANDFRNAWDDNCNRLNYLYAWSHRSNGEAGRVFWYNKCHDNKGHYYWTAPVHEFLNDLPNECTKNLPQKIYLHHHPDPTKSRATYLPLLEQRYQEYPDDYYGRVYLAHEYYYQGHYQKCIDFIHNHIFSVIKAYEIDCLADLYMFLGNSYKSLNQYVEAKENYCLGIKTKPDYVDNYYRLAELYISLNEYEKAIDIINLGLKKGRRQFSWLESTELWGTLAADLLCQAYYYLGAKETSLMYAKAASDAAPDDQRLKDNYILIKNELSIEK